jgi:hypothetical protein
MKTKGKVFIALGIFMSLVIGFLIGLSVDYPKVDDNSAAGTIRKINNFRKAQAPKTEIKIQNELVSDTSRQKSVQNALNFYYMTAVKMAGDVQYTLDEANTIEAFKTSNEKLMIDLANYGKFLSAARTDLLLAMSVCQHPADNDPLIVRELLNQAYNVIAQLNYRNRTVIEFVDALASFVEQRKTEQSQGLMKAHDLLTLNEISTAIMTRDKMLLKSFDKKTLLTDARNQTWVDEQQLNKLMKQDVEKLDLKEMEQLGLVVGYDAEQLRWSMFAFDVEQLGGVVGGFDAEKLWEIEVTDAEKLGFDYTDVEQLGID